jgi:obg-like ATPase 1
VLFRLPKIKAWIDQNNPGDPLIPFSVAFEERIASISAEEQAEEEKKVGAVSALGKITQAGYSSLDVSPLPRSGLNKKIDTF